MQFSVKQKGPFWSAVWPILHCKMAVVGTQNDPNGKAKGVILVWICQYFEKQNHFCCSPTPFLPVFRFYFIKKSGGKN